MVLDTLKYAMRSGSWRFAADLSAAPSEHTSSILWQGHPIYYRPGTSDITILYRILMKPRAKREYQIPPGLNPSVILDIGANIGASALLFAQEFPQAQIYCFEPVPQNFEILRKNIAAYPLIRALPYGLGPMHSRSHLFYSDDAGNRGGFSQFSPGSDTGKALEIEIRHSREALESIGIGHADLIKIDTEGAEYDILTSLGESWLSKASIILGELHGQRDFELLHYLEQWFQVGINKPVDSRLSHFIAQRRK